MDNSNMPRIIIRAYLTDRWTDSNFRKHIEM